MTTEDAFAPDRRRFTVRAKSGTSIVEIGLGATWRLGTLLDELGVPARRFIVSNFTVWRTHGARFDGTTREDPILISDGERFKTLATTGRIYDALLHAGADRGIAIVAVGGGVVGDVAGFAAATFLRGVPLVQVPTTLLAQVDSAIGGKVGVNHAMGKNLIGAFHQPVAVVVDPGLLSTLPRREFRSGLYEAVKYGMIASRPLFDCVGSTLPALFARDPAALLPLVVECCEIKGRVVESDERESGERRILNFGHTVGHALETITKYRRFRHGEAVAYGMMAAAELGVARGVLPPPDHDALSARITQLGPLPPVADLSTAQVLEAVARDKKVVAGRLHLVLPTAIGSTTIVADATADELTRALTAIGLRAERGRIR